MGKHRGKEGQTKTRWNGKERKGRRENMNERVKDYDYRLDD